MQNSTIEKRETESTTEVDASLRSELREDQGRPTPPPRQSSTGPASRLPKAIKFQKVTIAKKGEAINDDPPREARRPSILKAKDALVSGSEYAASGHEALAGAERDLAAHEADSARKRIMIGWRSSFARPRRSATRRSRPSPISRSCRFSRRRSTARCRRSYRRASSGRRWAPRRSTITSDARSRSRSAGAAAPRADAVDLRGQGQEGDQATARRRGASQERQQAALDDLHGAAGDSTGTASDGPARRRPLCDVRPQRSLSPRDQPEQPAQATARAGRAGHHRPQREAHAPGGRRRA